MGLLAHKATQNAELIGQREGNRIVLLKMKESQGNPLPILDSNSIT